MLEEQAPDHVDPSDEEAEDGDDDGKQVFDE